MADLSILILFTPIVKAHMGLPVAIAFVPGHHRLDAFGFAVLQFKLTANEVKMVL
jgi:hypothetical protein